MTDSNNTGAGYSGATPEQLLHYLKNRDRQAVFTRLSWLRAAKAALAGDPRELRNRVDLAESGPVTLTNGETEVHVPGAGPGIPAEAVEAANYEYIHDVAIAAYEAATAHPYQRYSATGLRRAVDAALAEARALTPPAGEAVAVKTNEPWRLALQRVRDQLGQAGGVGIAGAAYSQAERQVGNAILDLVDDELSALIPLPADPVTVKKVEIAPRDPERGLWEGVNPELLAEYESRARDAANLWGNGAGGARIAFLVAQLRAYHHGAAVLPADPVNAVVEAARPFAEFAAHWDACQVAYARKMQPEVAASMSDEEIAAIATPDTEARIDTGELRGPRVVLTMGTFRRLAAALATSSKKGA